MAYSDFKDGPTYASKRSGAGVGFLLVNALDASDVIVAAGTSLNDRNDFETIPVEEAGNDGVDEHVQGRHSGSGSLALYFTAQANDKLPTRENFLGKVYTVLRFIANIPGSDSPDTVLDAWVGVRISGINTQHGARGNLSIDASFVFTNHYNGEQYAEIASS